MKRKLIGILGLGLLALGSFAFGGSEVTSMKAKCDPAGCCGHCDRK